MKPDRKDAPEWAKWRAQDEDGNWVWHEEEPIQFEKNWYSVGRTAKTTWRDTLEARPNA